VSEDPFEFDFNSKKPAIVENDDPFSFDEPKKKQESLLEIIDNPPPQHNLFDPLDFSNI